MSALESKLAATKWDRSIMKLNTQQWRVRSNIRNNIRRPLPQFRAYQENGEQVVIVGGGWSLEETLPELRDLVFEGVKVVALNGAGNWLVQHNIRPSAVVVLDARPQNVSFLSEPIPRCKYFLASQAHPVLFDACEGRDVTMFHVVSTEGEQERKRLDRHFMKCWQECPSSGTVGIVAICLFRLLGYRSQHIFGLDSCYKPGSKVHHAYSQPWNDAEGCAEFECGGRMFECSAWQASQSGEFVDMVRSLGDKLRLEVHGDGLLAHILKTGAELAPITEMRVSNNGHTGI